MSRVLPILFNTDMVCAILDGRKTVTRRVMKPQPKMALTYILAGYGCGKWSYPSKTAHEFWGEKYKRPDTMTKEDENALWTPPCNTDDILYVRETWADASENCGISGVSCGECHLFSPCYLYRATPDECFVCEDTKWRPSIHMPKEAARIWLKVTDVRVERLQDITEEQAKAEGITGYSKDGKLYKYAVTNNWWIDYHRKHKNLFSGSWWQDMPKTIKESFGYLWDSTIKKADLSLYGWNANPWVWVIEFERCEIKSL